MSLEYKGSRRERYAEGYKSKVLYWTEQLEEATLNGDWFKMERALGKLNYFVVKQSEWLYDKKMENKVKQRLA